MKIHKNHVVKIHPEHFEKIMFGLKTAEIRFNDRKYKVGDEIKFREWCPKKKKYTGQVSKFMKITDITKIEIVIQQPCVYGWVMLSLGEVIHAR